MKRRYAILAIDCFEDNAKTAHGVIAYGTDDTVAVIDPSHAGKRVSEVVPHLRCDAPVVASLAEAMVHAPTSLLIGTAPKGGELPESWRAEVRAALTANLDVVSGLHDMLGDDREFRSLAHAHETAIWDVRKPPQVPLFSGAVYDVPAPTLLMVGNDCAVGKMTVALELARAATNAGKRAAFVPTGQTGIMIAGWGISIDRVIADFASGATETLVLYAAQTSPDLLIVEGQGAINHPAYACVTLALMHGAAPDALILVCDVSRETVAGFATPTLGYAALIAIHEELLAAVKPARVAAIALNTRGLDDARARAEIERARTETGLPADDVVRFGADKLFGAIAPNLRRLPPLGGSPA